MIIETKEDVGSYFEQTSDRTGRAHTLVDWMQRTSSPSVVAGLEEGKEELPHLRELILQ